MKLICALLIWTVACPTFSALQSNKPNISVKEVHPESIPKGDCTQSESGYLEKNDGTHTNHYIPFTESEVGQYVASRVKHGYVLTLYPQESGRIWVTATCGEK